MERAGRLTCATRLGACGHRLPAVEGSCEDARPLAVLARPLSEAAQVPDRPGVACPFTNRVKSGTEVTDGRDSWEIENARWKRDGPTAGW